MRIEITNSAALSGAYDGDTLNVESTVATTEIVNGLSANKTASKALWSGGNMTYTIVVTNDTDIPFENPVFEDALNALLVIVPNSFKVDGTAHVYTVEGNTVKANLSTIPADGSITITFDVTAA